MPAPKPLTATPPPALDWSRDEAPASSDFDDIYFSVDNGLEETRAVFLNGCGLPQGWQDKPQFAIGELGFGTGLNFLATRQLWQKTKPNNGHLHFVSIEKYPLSTDDLARTLASWPSLSEEATCLIAQWPDRVKGIHRLHLAPDVTLTLFHMDVAEALGAIDAQINAWFLDGFSPAKNPDMWSPEIMQAVAKCTAPGARLSTFTVAGFVREGLTAAGFSVEKKPGFGRKRHRLEAVFKGEPQTPAGATISPLIIGGGIAGASLAKAFSRRGIRSILIENNQPAASGNPAAIVKPRLDLQDRPESRFFLASYLYALRAYGETEGVLSRSVRQIPKSEADTKRFRKLIDQAALPNTHMCIAGDDIFFGEAQIIEPNIVTQSWKNDANVIQQTVANIRRGTGVWQAINAEGDVIASGTHIFIAAGFGIRALCQKLEFRYSRGQLTWADPCPDITAPIAYGGYAIPMDEGLLLGATHDRLTTDNPFNLIAEDDVANVAALKSAIGIDATLSDRSSRASIRVTSADTLPVCDEVGENKWVLSGLGSRGFVYAPLLAEVIVSKICGEPLPIDRELETRFRAKARTDFKNHPA